MADDEQHKNFSAARQPRQRFPSTFQWVLLILGALILIGILAAAWKLFPDLVSQISAPSVAASPTTPMETPSKPKEKELKAPNEQQQEQKVQKLPAEKEESKVNTLLSDLQAIPKPTTSQQLLQNDTGIPDGSTLGIIDCKLIDIKPTSRTLRIAIKGRFGSAIEVQNVKIHVYFYDKTSEGEVVLTDSPIRSQWVNQPVEWTNGNPQLLDVSYSGPPPPNVFYGYIVGVYYNNELQDSRAFPAQLARDFPPPVLLAPEPILTPAPP